MSSAEAQVVYNRSSSSEPMEAQKGFAQQFDLSQPEKAMGSYQKLMHQHTKQQFEMVKRRRSSTGNSDMAPLSSEESHGSISSTAS